MPNNLSGQFNLVSATEGTAILPGSNIASFNDSTPGDQATNFTATIDWGDGTVTGGTVVGANGSFTVEGAHTYADEGSPTGTVTITRNTDNTQLVLQGGVSVADADNLVSEGAPVVTGNAGASTGTVTVATFKNNPNSPTPFINTAGDFTINIDWGDGQTTAGSATLGADNVYTVTGSHIYAANGQYSITTFMNDDGSSGDTNVGVATNQADIGFGGTVTLTAAAETVAVPAGTIVANFSDNTGDPVTDYSASISWGDGTTTAGVVSGSGPSFTVTSAVAHTYADEGTPTATVTINRAADGAVPSATIAPSGTVTVVENDQFTNAVGTTVTGSPGVSTGNVTLATFQDFSAFAGGSPAPASDFVATVDWGDGNTSFGTITGSGNNYTVTGSHTYAQNGQDTITIGISDGGEAQENGQNTANITTQSTALIGIAPVAGANISATEGTAVAAGTNVGTFSDSNNTDAATDFTAQVDWGDGVTTTGTVTGSNGQFTVTGGPHTYGDEGPEAVTTTVTHTSDNSTITISGQANVADADHLALTGDSFSGNAGQALNNVQVATFTDTYTGNAASDFLASISWGDGTTTGGTVSGSGGTFTVDGSHTYTNGGNDTVTITVFDDGVSTATASGTATASINLGGTMVLTSATEGTAIPNGTPVATFNDSTAGDTASSFTASIAWGDGTTTSGSVVGGPSPGTFTVEGGHTYTDEGNDTAVVTLTRPSDASTASVSGPVAVAEADSLTGTGTTVNANANSAFSGTVATFTDTDTANVASDFTATINWDDGTTSAGTVSGSNGSFTVMGSHTYAAPGQDFIKVTLADDAPGTATATATTTANIAARMLAGTMVLASATEATALSNTTTVATFTDTDTSDMAGDFAATINWGDGQTTTGTIVGGNGSFTVEGGHTYADEGSDPASVTFTHTADGLSATASGTVSVAEGDALTGHGTSFSITQNQVFSGTVATFSDIDTANVAGDFSATVDWGDGTTTAGTVSGSNGTFSVSGSHTYTTAGFDTVKVTLADDAPGTATATATSTAEVGFPGQEVLHAATEGKQLPNNTPVATFTDNNPADHANSFTATIAWGDGVTTAGTVVGSGGTFTVEGGHRYLDEGNDNATVTLTRTSDHLQSTASGTVAVGEGDVLSPSGRIGLALPTFSGTIATFDDDGNPFNVPGDFTATIDWGDGTTTSGTVTGSGDDFAVNGSHTYTTTGIDVVKVTLTDDAPGTATATATSLVLAVAPGHHSLAASSRSDVAAAASSDSTTGLLSQIESFSGASVAPSAGTTMPDGSIVKATGNFDHGNNSDLVAQSSDGTPEIWMMNGTSGTGAVVLSNPGASWNVIATGDFNGDGNTDILFQNSNGTVGIWEMNGTSVASMTGLSNPGSSWHAIGTGDFNGDGNADILFQNDDGTPMIWEMNGTTVVGQATLTNPGSQWHAVATGDFFGDGHTDILWQSTDGTPGIWQMNGTSIVAEGALPNPGTSWKVIGTGDFTNDGKSGILWQGSDGTIGVWTMDGMTPTTMTAVPNVVTNASQASGSPQPTMHGSSPDIAGAAAAQSASLLVPGTTNWLQQLTSGAGLHLT